MVETRLNPKPSRKAIKAAQPDPEFIALLSGSKWTEDHLISLGVQYDVEDEHDLANEVFATTKPEWDRTYGHSESISQSWLLI
jgi:hypothetical protein